MAAPKSPGWGTINPYLFSGIAFLIVTISELEGEGSLVIMSDSHVGAVPRARPCGK